MHTLSSILERTISSPSGCMEWQGCFSRDGYANIKHAGRNWTGQRLVAFLCTGVIGDDAMHSCDNRRCLNPDHISWGTRKQNLMDMSARNRSPLAVLNTNTVVRLRQDYSAGEMQKDLACKYGISKSTVSAIVRGRTWKLTGGPIKPAIKRKKRGSPVKFNLPTVGATT